MAMLFRYAKVSPIVAETETYEWVDVPASLNANDARIFNLQNFQTYEAILNLNNPIECEEKLQSLVLEIEESSPVGKAFGHKELRGSYMIWLPNPHLCQSGLH